MPKSIRTPYISSLQKTSLNIETADTNLNLQHEVKQGSKLHSWLDKDSRVILGYTNNIFEYNKGTRILTISTKMKELITLLIELGNNIDLSHIHTLQDLNTALQASPLYINHGDKNQDGTIQLERRDLKDEYIPQAQKDKLNTLLFALGITKPQQPIKFHDAPDTCPIFGAFSERMYQRINRTLEHIGEKKSSSSSKIILLGGNRDGDKFRQDEIDFLSNLGIKCERKEKDAQFAILQHISQKLKLNIPSENIIRPKPTPIPTDSDRGRSNTLDTVYGYIQYIIDNKLPVPKHLSLFIEEPFGRLPDTLAYKLKVTFGGEFADTQINVFQDAKYDTSKIDSAPIKVALGEVVKKYYQVMLNITELEKESI